MLYHDLRTKKQPAHRPRSEPPLPAEHEPQTAISKLPTTEHGIYHKTINLELQQSPPSPLFYVCGVLVARTVCMPGTCGGQKRSLDALELESCLVVSLCTLRVKL